MAYIVLVDVRRTVRADPGIPLPMPRNFHMLEGSRLRRQPRFHPMVGVAAWVAAVLLSAPLIAGAAVTVHYTDVDLTDLIAGQDLRAYDYAVDGSFSDGDTLTLEFPAAGFDQITLVSGPGTLFAAPPLPAVLGAPGLLMLTAPAALPATFHDSLRVSFVSVGLGSGPLAL